MPDTRALQSQPGYQTVRGNDVSSPSRPTPASYVDNLAKSIVLGGMDGLLAAAMVLSATAGGGLSWQYSMIVGFPTVLALSMTYGLNEYLSFKNQRDYVAAARRNKMWELKQSRDAVVQQTVRRFASRGMSVADAEIVVSKMASYDAFFVGLVVADDLGIVVDDDDASLITEGFISIVSFASIGCIPLVLYASLAALSSDATSLYPLTLAASLALAFMLGALKGQFVEGSATYLGVEAVTVVCVAAAVAFSTARLVSNHVSR